MRLEERDRYLVILPKQKGPVAGPNSGKRRKTIGEQERIFISVVDSMIV